jgi:hypothetical protein
MAPNAQEKADIVAGEAGTTAYADESNADPKTPPQDEP